MFSSFCTLRINFSFLSEYQESLYFQSDRRINKLAKLRGCVSWVHFAKIHFEKLRLEKIHLENLNLNWAIPRKYFLGKYLSLHTLQEKFKPSYTPRSIWASIYPQKRLHTPKDFCLHSLLYIFEEHRALVPLGSGDAYTSKNMLPPRSCFFLVSSAAPSSLLLLIVFFCFFLFF